MTEDNKTGFLIVTVAKKDYSLRISEVIGILKLHRNAIFPIPYDKKSCIRGIFNYKGNVVGLINVKDLSPLSDDNKDENLTAVLLCSNHNQFAILVDYAKAVSDTPDEKVIPLNVKAIYDGENNADN